MLSPLARRVPSDVSAAKLDPPLRLQTTHRLLQQAASLYQPYPWCSQRSLWTDLRPPLAVDGEFHVAPFDIRFSVTPETVRLKQAAEGQLTVTRSFSSLVSPIQAVLDERYIAGLTPFFCAEVLLGGAEDADPHLPVFLDFPYGQTTDGLFNCSTGRVFEAGGGDTETATFAYPTSAADGAPEGGYRPVVYGGLASRSMQVGGEWAWATALPETQIGQPLVESRTLTVLPTVWDKYTCGTSPRVDFEHASEQVGRCFKRIYTGAMQRDETALGVTTTDWNNIQFVTVRDYCINPETDEWEPRLTGLDLTSTYSACPDRAEGSVPPEFVFGDASDPSINNQNVDEIIARVQALAEIYSGTRDRSVLQNGLDLAQVWFEAETLAHERSHAEFHGTLLRALVTEGLQSYFSRNDPEVLSVLLRRDALFAGKNVRDVSPDLFDRGLNALLADLAVPNERFGNPRASGVRDRRDRCSPSSRPSATCSWRPLPPQGTNSTLHYRQYQRGARELRRIESELRARFGR